MPSQRALQDRRTTLRDAAVSAARVAAAFIRERTSTRHELDIREKLATDFVSEVDTGAESRIREVLMEAVPDAVIVGEELSPRQPVEGETVFIVDPLDGTTNFLHGFPVYAVSIGALVDGTDAAGVVLDVPRDELFVSTAGGGAWCNGERIAVSKIDRPNRALVGTGFPFKSVDYLPEYMQQFDRLTRALAGLRRAGSAALDLAWVASGRFDAFWELRLAPWDMAAGIQIVREAGGRATDMAGADLVPGHAALVASNGLLHDWLLDCLRGEPVPAR